LRQTILDEKKGLNKKKKKKNDGDEKENKDNENNNKKKESSNVLENEKKKNCKKQVQTIFKQRLTQIINMLSSHIQKDIITII